MDVVTTYLYVSLENDIYMKLPRRFNLPNNTNSKDDYAIKLNRFLLWIKAIRTYVV